MGDVVRRETTTVFAVDKSGSTAGCARYWSRVRDVYNSLLPSLSGRTGEGGDAGGADPRSTDDFIIVLWDSEARRVGVDDLLSHVRRQHGFGGTRLASVCEFLKNNVLRGRNQAHVQDIRLYVCTDGQIDKRDVTASDVRLSGISFNHVQVCIEESDRQHSPLDVSVAAPFLRKSNYIVKINGEIRLQGDTRTRLHLPVVNTLEEFEEVKNEIWQSVYPRLGANVASTGEDRQILHDWLLETRRKILSQMSRRRTATKTRELSRLLKLLMEGKELDVLMAIRIGAAIGDQTPGDIVEEAFAPLISITDSSDFSAGAYGTFPSARLARKANAGEVDESVLWGDFENAADLASICAITGEMDIPVLMFRKPPAVSSNNGLFCRLDSKAANYVATQPLNTLRSESALDLLVSCIDHPMGLQSYLKWVHEGGHNTSPFTRAQLAGCIPMSSHPDLVTYGNKFMCQLLWDGKLVGIPVMWQWVLYFALRDHPKLEYIRVSYPDFLDSMKSTLVTRTNFEVTRLGMSGLGTYPLELVPVSVACWYAVRGSSVLYAERLLNRQQERLLQFRSIAKELAEIAQLCGIQIDMSAVLERVKQLRLVEALFDLTKADETYAEKLLRAVAYERYEFEPQNEACFSLTQEENRFVVWDKRINTDSNGILPLDDKIPLVLRHFNFNEYLRIYLAHVKPYVDPSGPWPVYKYSQIPLPLTENLKKPENTNLDVSFGQEKSYGYKEENGSYFFADSPICPRTMRCFYVDRRTGKNWRQAAEETMGPLDRQVSAYKYYWKAFAKLYRSLSPKERETGRNERNCLVGFPNLKQILIAVERGQKLKGFNVLPADFHLVVQSIIDDYAYARREYERVFKVFVTPKVFREILASSQDYGPRQELENSWLSAVESLNVADL